MNLYEAYKQNRSQYPTMTSLQALLHAKHLLKEQDRQRFDLDDEPQTLEHKGFFVVVKVESDYDHQWDDDSIGTIYGLNDGYDFQDVADNGYGTEFTFENPDHEGELVGFDLGGGETFAGLLEYYRDTRLSKQMAYEAAMRHVKTLLEYTLDIYEQANDRYTQHYEAYDVIARVYESEEAYEEDEHSYLADDSLWGIEVDTRRWREARDYISERAWDCIEVAVEDAQRAEFYRIKAAGNVPLFEGV